jgi:hypothetical protein
MRIIDQLRRLYPGEWHYNAPVWVHETGFSVYRCLLPHEHYRRTDTGKVVGMVAQVLPPGPDHPRS